MSNPKPPTGQIAKYQQPPKWKHQPTKSLRIPEILLGDIEVYARQLDNGESNGHKPLTLETVTQWLETLEATDLIALKTAIDSAIIEAKKRTEERRLEQAILFLAGRCDGARTDDGVGFSGADTGFGHWLADRLDADSPLLKAHAEAALKMIQKYRHTQLEPAGYTLPEWGAIAHQYGAKIHRTSEDLDRLPAKRIDLIEDSIAVYAPYDPTGGWQRKAKAIEGYNFYGEKKGGDNSWRYPLVSIEEIVKAFPAPEYAIDESVLGMIQVIQAQKAEELAAKVKEAEEKAYGIIGLISAAELDRPLPCGLTLFDHQKEAVKWLLAHRKGGIHSGGILADHMGLGKAQPLNTLLLTPLGWKNMGDIKIGDFVIGSDGRPTRVMGVYPQGLKQVYRINFTDGSSVECCDEHLWAVRTPDQKRRSSDFKILSLRILIDSGLSYRNGNLKYYIPMTAPVQFAPKQFYLHPYILGFLLGDGSLSNTSVSWTKPNPEIAEIVSQFLPDDTEIHELDESVGHYSIVGKTHGSNSVLDELRKLELMGCLSSDKFIPNSYKFADVDSRISLLQGLLDSDGSASADGVVLEYGSTSKQLALDVMFLVESLGGTAKWSVRTPWYTYKNEVRQGQLFYRLNISLPTEIFPFKCRQKADKYVPRSKYQPSRGIKSVEMVGEKQCQCIAVDAPNHLYLTEHCIVTHNTLSALVAAKAMQKSTQCAIFVVCPVSLKNNWLREAGRVEVAIEVFSWAKLPKPLETAKYLLIGDEAHYCQDERSQRSQKFQELASAENCLTAWLLTGTPIKNGRPINLFPLLAITKHPLAAERWEYQRRYCAAHHKSIGKKSVWDNSGASHLDELAKKTEDVILGRTKKECLDLPAKIRSMKPAELEAAQAKAYQAEIKKLVDDYKERAKRGEVDPDAQALVTLNFLRKVGSEFKVNTAIALASEIREQGGQIVLFTEYVESAKALYTALGGELLTGETPTNERQALVDRFQSGQSKIFTGTIKAGGVGLTLTAASNVILVDRPWTPGDAEQAEDRCHRIGQADTVNTFWVQLGIIDEAIDALLESKQQRIELVLKGKTKTLQGLQSPKELAKELLEIL